MKRYQLLAAFLVVALVEAVYQTFWSKPLVVGEKATMKHFLVLVCLTCMGVIGSLYHPFWGILLYYTLAVVRPQYLWRWSLPVEWRWSLIAALIVVAATFIHLPRLLQKSRPNIIAGFMLAYGVLILLSCVTALNPEVAQYWGIEYAKIMLIGLVATLVINSLKQVRLLAAVITLGLGYVAYELNFLYFVHGRLDIYHYGYSGLDNNGAGLMLAMGIPFAFVHGVHAPKRWQRAAAWAIGLLLLHAVLMSYSRGAMLACSLAVLWLILHNRSKLQSALIIVALAVSVSVLAGKEIRSRFLSTTEYSTDQSANLRYESWGAAWDMAMENPWLGMGIRNSNQYTFNYGADHTGRTIHSQYLQIAADMGLPAMAVYVTMLALALANLRRARAQCLDYLRRHDTETKDELDEDIKQISAVSLGCEASLIAFAFGGIFLSLEVFELPWMLIALAGILPNVTHRHLADRHAWFLTPTPLSHIRGRERVAAATG